MAPSTPAVEPTDPTLAETAKGVRQLMRANIHRHLDDFFGFLKTDPK